MICQNELHQTRSFQTGPRETKLGPALHNHMQTKDRTEHQ